MKRTRLTLVKNVTSHSKANERSTRTTTPFTDWVFQNPFGKERRIDWLSILVLALLSASAILFILVMRMIAASV